MAFQDNITIIIHIQLQYPLGPLLINLEQFSQAMEVDLPLPIAFHHVQLGPVQTKKQKFEKKKKINAIKQLFGFFLKLFFRLLCITFFTRSFNCFLPWSIRNPGVFGEETFITCKNIGL